MGLQFKSSRAVLKPGSVGAILSFRCIRSVLDSGLIEAWNHKGWSDVRMGLKLGTMEPAMVVPCSFGDWPGTWAGLKSRTSVWLWSLCIQVSSWSMEPQALGHDPDPCELAQKMRPAWTMVSLKPETQELA